MQVAVTGGRGFICGEIVRQLLEEYDVEHIYVIDNNSKHSTKNDLPYSGDDPRVSFINYDLTEVVHNIRHYKHLANIFSKCDYIIHGAAVIGGIKLFHDLPYTIISENDAILQGVLDPLIHLTSRPKFTYISSSMVYESTTIYPSQERDTNIIPIPMSSYGFSKLSGERYLDAFNREYGLDYVIVRPFNVTGCGEYPQTEVGMAHVTNDIIRKIHDGQGTEEYPLEILGDGNQIRHYTVLQECAAGILAATFLGQSGEAYNIGSQKGHTVNQLVQIIWHKMRPNQTLYKKHIDGYEFDVQKRVPNTCKAEHDFGFACKLTLEDTIKDTIQWTVNVLEEENVKA